MACREFLSCLYGSEPPTIGDTDPDVFLSCLYGSERGLNGLICLYHFLSCLYGSEPDPRRCMRLMAISKLPVRQ
ncbi:hypothetical protein HMPREF9688_00077 [Klebsiella oxytoca 10-5244]|nr:hypothetical protein HMPREF9688_00077 [Klebsiella oxytoca 10-5244]